MARCKRRPTVHRREIGAELRFELDANTAEFTVRVVDAAGAPSAWELGFAPAVAERMHFAAGESWVEDDLSLEDALELVIVGSAVADVAEIIVWEG